MGVAVYMLLGIAEWWYVLLPRLNDGNIRIQPNQSGYNESCEQLFGGDKACHFQR